MVNFTLAMFCTLAVLHGGEAYSGDNGHAATQSTSWSTPADLLGIAPVCQLIVAQDGNIVACRADRVATLWSCDEAPRVYGAVFGIVRVSRDGSYLAIQESDHEIVVRAYPSLRVLYRMHSDEKIHELVGVSDTGDSVFWISRNTVYRGVFAAGRLQRNRIACFGERLIQVATVSPDGRYVAVVESLRSVVHVLDTQKNHLDTEFAIDAVIITSVTFSGVGESACAIVIGNAVMSPCDTITVIDLAKLRVDFVLDPPDGRVIAAAVSGDGSALATTHPDGIARVWDLRTRKVVREIAIGAGAAIALDRKSDYIVIVNGTGDVVRMRLSGEVVKTP